MSTITQHNPNIALNERLRNNGLHKTVYALVTPETEAVKNRVFGDLGSIDRAEYLLDFREAWTGKQDQIHEEFFNVWHEWSKPVIDLDRNLYPFYYPTAGASEPIRQIIFDHAAKYGEFAEIHVFEGEYEGYKAMAEAAGIRFKEHSRANWRESVNGFTIHDLFMISQPSAIDGNVWLDFNEFVETMSFGGRLSGSVVADITYVGAVPRRAIKAKFNLNAAAIKAVVFSLSKPFGVYYDRIGGVFFREQNLALFGNKWFKNLTSLRIGTELLKAHDVFCMPETYSGAQMIMTAKAEAVLRLTMESSDVFILATGATIPNDPVSEYLVRAGRVRVCLTPGMASMIGTTGTNSI